MSGVDEWPCCGCALYSPFLINTDIYWTNPATVKQQNNYCPAHLTLSFDSIKFGIQSYIFGIHPHNV